MERILNRTIAVRREVTKPQTFSRLILQSKGRGKYAIMRTLTVITLWLTVWPILPQNGGETRLKIEEQGSERKKTTFSDFVSNANLCVPVSFLD